MAGPVEHDIFWRIVEWVGWAVGAAASAIVGFCFRTYRRDRKKLGELDRKMREIDAIREDTEDGQLALRRLDVVDQELRHIRREQKQSKERTQKMAVSIARIEENIDWLCIKHGKFESDK